VNRYELTVAGIAPEESRGAMPGIVVEIWIPVGKAPLMNGQGDWLSGRRMRKPKRVCGAWRRNRLRPAAASVRA